jgi:hypothetical protein
LDAHPRSAATWARLWRTPDRAAVVLAIAGPVAPDDAAWLCTRAQALLSHTDGATLVCDVTAVTTIELGTVDVIARVALVARRLDRPFRLSGASPDLCSLLAALGLGGVLAR